MNDDEITAVATGELCPHCSYENRLLIDYHNVVEVLRGGDSNLPIIRCTGCGKRLAPCSVCTDAIDDGYITENERTCDNCPILAYWDKKYGEEKETTMTEEKKTPSLEDITKSFYEKCECTKHSYDLTCNTACDYCGVGVSGINSGCSGEGTSMGECVQKYIYEVATGARDINKPLWNPPKTPEWLKVGAKLWRKAYCDWYTILSIDDAGEEAEHGDKLFNITMVASDGSEDEATLTAFAFTTDAPFSESFRQLIGKRAWHKGFGVLVDIIEYDYEDNTVHLSYTDKHGISDSAWEEFHEENFEAVKVPSWFKAGQWIGATKDCHAIGRVEAVDGDILEVDWIANGEPVGEQFDLTCSTQVLAFVPVKFRPYDYKEAKALLGKTMEYEPPYLQVRYEGALIHRVTQYECAEEIHLNSRSFGAWKEMNATIDSLPIGVPVVDEELLSNP